MASPTPPQDQGDSRDETEEERDDRIREDLRARMPAMAGLDRRGELSVSQEDAREIQQRSQQDTRLRNSSRLIRARDAYEARRALGIIRPSLKQRVKEPPLHRAQIHLYLRHDTGG
ncbi:hypothetical protein J4E86_001321 [Alternaria arbusti]|uniref:uncharacterized protein n=1 Tax=Alternaria arbusti TaxID=232088 RepID=UPI002220E3C1|nr:uncharacterized protein J4E86_001321 [Alternaria arbusti]KAI4962289.1 hypothetical protein J4E86_001321 [Alternaria arbusti]